LSAPDGFSLLTIAPSHEGVTLNEYRRILGVSSK
jgi:hypothetical protein